MKSKVDSDSVKKFLTALQDKICDGLQKLEPQRNFSEDCWQHDNGGGGRTRILQDGATFESAGVNFSHIKGEQLPLAATAQRKDIAGRAFEAMGVSLVVHPLNPYVPTSHMNVRFLVASHKTQPPIWWFGGGYDLTPYYGFEEDVVHWHQTARSACADFGDNTYEKYKKWCDEYFYLRHRDECRGIGGLFFDDLNQPDFTGAFSFMRSVGESFMPAYEPIVVRRKDSDYGARERDWQLYRRGRYVEFNLVYDRGTIFGLQTGGRTESILMSLPPRVRWQYNYSPEPDSAERELYEKFLPPRDWLS